MNFYTMSTIFNQTTNALLSHGWMLPIAKGVRIHQGSWYLQCVLRARPGTCLYRVEGVGCCKGVWVCRRILVSHIQDTQRDTDDSSLQYWFETKAAAKQDIHPTLQ